MSSEDHSRLPGCLPPAELRVGLKTWFRRTLTEGDMPMFIGAPWDVNPLHTDETYARQSRFGRRHCARAARGELADTPRRSVGLHGHAHGLPIPGAGPSRRDDHGRGDDCRVGWKP